MHYIVTDFEWNQVTFKDRPAKLPDGRMLPGEIIQIGAVKLNERFEYEGQFKTSVRAKFYTHINPRVAEVTGLTQGDINCGYQLPYLIDRFKAFCGDEFVFITWGEEDIPILKDNLTLHGLDTGWIPKVYDLQEIYDDQVAHESRRCNLTAAAEKVGAETMTAHDALGDSLSTVNILHKLDMEKGIALYREHLNPQGDAWPQTDADNAEFESMDEAITSCLTATFTCPECGKMGSVGEWARQRSDLDVNVGHCPGNHHVFIRIRFKRAGGGCRIARMMYPLDEAREGQYQNILKRYREEQEEKKAIECNQTADGVWSF